MVHRTYIGLGRGDAAISAFEGLRPYALKLYGLQAECEHGTADWAALGVAVGALETTAYHFTRRRDFYDRSQSEARAAVKPTGRLADRAEALKEFEALRAYDKALIALREKCRPYGPDYLALVIASEGLQTAVLHFTGDDRLYAAAPCGPFRG